MVLLGWPVGHFPVAWVPQAPAEPSVCACGRSYPSSSRNLNPSHPAEPAYQQDLTKRLAATWRGPRFSSKADWAGENRSFFIFFQIFAGSSYSFFLALASSFSFLPIVGWYEGEGEKVLLCRANFLLWRDFCLKQKLQMGGWSSEAVMPQVRWEGSLRLALRTGWWRGGQVGTHYVPDLEQAILPLLASVFALMKCGNNSVCPMEMWGLSEIISGKCSA